MKKLTMIGVVLIAGTIFVNAQTDRRNQLRVNMMKSGVPLQIVSSTTRVIPPQGEARPEIMPPVIRTGDDVTDAKIKALTIEMETKIKAIRDDYQTKLKEIIGTRKIISTTPLAPKMPVVDVEENGSSTDENIPPMPRRFLGQIQGVSTEGVGQAVSQDISSRMKSFFGGLFGR